MLKKPLVSVLVPIYNVEKYLEQCLFSLTNQTLKDIEIICLNDGSTDSSLEIVKRYAKDDPRFVIINKPNSGYGDSMNKGLEKATGEYVGILESDDFIEPEAFEHLYNLAKENHAEVARANYFHYLGGENTKQYVIDRLSLDRVIDPRIEQYMFYQAPAIWSAIYKRDFLNKNNIRFLPTPGASYQDTSFNFKVWACCRKAVFTDNAYFHYRLDNESSSVNNPGKVFCVCDEYAEIERYLKEHNLFDELKQVMYVCKWGAYVWNIDRLAPKLAKQFIERMREEYANVELDRSYFNDIQWQSMQNILHHSATTYLLKHNLKKQRLNLKIKFSNFNKRLRPAYRRQIAIMAQTDMIAEQLNYIRNSLKEPKSTTLNTGTAQISIIVTTYNDEKYIERCLSSLVKQTFHDIDIIVVDDASSDDTVKKIKDYMKDDSRIKLIALDKNGGVSNARNRALKKVKTPYIMFCDGDDYYAPTMCAEMYTAITEKKADLATCRISIIYKAHFEMRESDDVYYQHHFSGHRLATPEVLFTLDSSVCNKIFRYKLIEKYHLSFPDGTTIGEDAYFAFAYGVMSRDVVFVDHPLYLYTRREDSAMSTHWKKKAYVDYSIDHVKICIQLHKFLKENNLFDEKYYTFFWQFFCEYVVSAHRWCKSNNMRARIRKESQEFVAKNENETTKLPEAMQKHLERLISNFYYSPLWRILNKIKTIGCKIRIKLFHRFGKISTSQTWTFVKLGEQNRILQDIRDRIEN